MAFPVFIFDGQDGAGKTSQLLLLGNFLTQELGVPAAYISNPVYEFKIGRTIGRCLGRWGSKEDLGLRSPEDMAALFALNRLETLPFLKDLVEKDFLLLFNRGPYANLYNVARRVLEDKIEWKSLTPDEKEARVNAILDLDREFLDALGEKRELVHIFMSLDPKESMGLARQRALSTLGTEPDAHEKSEELQSLTVELYKEIAKGQIPGQKADLIESTRGRLPHDGGRDMLGELDGIFATAKRIIPAVFSRISEYARYQNDFWKIYTSEVPEYVYRVLRSEREGGAKFEFRKILKIGREQYPDLDKTRSELMAEIRESKPGVWAAIEASRRLDEKLARSVEGDYRVGKERR